MPVRARTGVDIDLHRYVADTGRCQLHRGAGLSPAVQRIEQSGEIQLVAISVAKGDDGIDVGCPILAGAKAEGIRAAAACQTVIPEAAEEDIVSAPARMSSSPPALKRSSNKLPT